MKLNIAISNVTATLIDEKTDSVVAEYTLGNASVFINVDAVMAALIELLGD